MAVTAIGDRRFCTAPINGLAENDNERAPKINKHNYRFRFSAMKSMDDTARKLHFMSCLHGTLFFWPQYFGVLCVCLCAVCGHYYYSLYVVHILLHTKADSRGSINLFTIYLWFACNVCHLAYIHVLNSGNYKTVIKCVFAGFRVACVFCVRFVCVLATSACIDNYWQNGIN